MYHRKKDKKKKIITISVSLCLVLAALLLSLSVNRNYMLVESFFKDISVVIQKTFMYPLTSLTKEKDEDLSKSYLIQKNVNSSLEKEIKELKDTLELNKTLTEYNIVNATVLSRNKSYWFNTITIDKGKKDGIEKEMAVVTKNGLVGKINKVSHNSSEIKLITSDDINYKVSVGISTSSGDTYAVLNGYDKNNKLLMVTGVDKTIGVKENDTVTTSGLGGKEPKGIYIGVVKKQENDKYNLSKNLYIETSQDFNSIHYVTILKGKKNDK